MGQGHWMVVTHVKAASSAYTLMVLSLAHTNSRKSPARAHREGGATQRASAHSALGRWLRAAQLLGAAAAVRARARLPPQRAPQRAPPVRALTAAGPAHVQRVVDGRAHQPAEQDVASARPPVQVAHLQLQAASGQAARTTGGGGV
jgi:hypothetical protein